MATGQELPASTARRTSVNLAFVAVLDACADSQNGTTWLGAIQGGFYGNAMNPGPSGHGMRSCELNHLERLIVGRRTPVRPIPSGSVSIAVNRSSGPVAPAQGRRTERFVASSPRSDAEPLLTETLLQERLDRGVLVGDLAT